MAHLRGLWAPPSLYFVARPSSLRLLNISFSPATASAAQLLSQMVSEDFPFAVSFALQWARLSSARAAAAAAAGQTRSLEPFRDGLHFLLSFPLSLSVVI